MRALPLLNERRAQEAFFSFASSSWSLHRRERAQGLLPMRMRAGRVDKRNGGGIRFRNPLLLSTAFGVTPLDAWPGFIYRRETADLKKTYIVHPPALAVQDVRTSRQGCVEPRIADVAGQRVHPGVPYARGGGEPLRGGKRSG